MPSPSDVPSAGAAKYVRWFAEIGAADVGSVGGKNASLGEMYGALASQGVRVPNGFAITAEGYRYVLDQADAWPRLHEALAGLDARDVDDLASRAAGCVPIAPPAASSSRSTPNPDSARRSSSPAPMGLGENVVQGSVDPDEFYVFKPTFRQGRRTVLRRKLGGKEIRMVYAAMAGRETTRNVPTPREDQLRFCIADEDVLNLADAAIRIEDHYSARAGRPTPMDIEWAKDGLDGQLYIVQARPETVDSQRPVGLVDEYRLTAKGALRASGRAVGAKIAAGTVRVVTDASQLGEFRPGEVLVADTTMPDWGTVMKAAAAVVTNRGGRTCHAA